MSQVLSKSEKKSTENLSKWNKAIADAKKGIHRLELAIETCQQMRDAGEPWPGEFRTPTQI